jgi:signal transduction histidine kinase/ligand-binding sensor domain-containing protein
MAQTADGHLWLGATSGLYRFDGTRFELFRSPFGDRLLYTNVAELFAADGGLWVGYAFGGFSFVKNGRVRNYPAATGRVINFARDAHGVIWAGANRPGQSGLWRFEGDTWRAVGPEWGMPEKPVAQAAFDRDGILWVLLGSRGPEYTRDLYYSMPGERRFRKAAEGLQSQMWAVDADKRVLTTPGPARAAGSSTIELPGPLPSYPVLTTHFVQFVDRANGVWTVPGDKGVWRFAAAQPLDAVVKAIPRAESEIYDIKDMVITGRLVDREGSVWIAGAAVLHRFSYTAVLTWDRPSSAGPYFIVLPDEEGAVWVTASSGQNASALNRVAGGVTTARPFPAGVSTLGYRAPDKTYWFGGEGGLWHMAGEALTKVELPPGLANQGRRLQSMTQDRSGAMWVAFNNFGLYRLKDGEWTRHRSPGQAEDKCPQARVAFALTDTRGRVVLSCADARMAIVDGERERSFGAEDGIEVGNVTALAERGRGIWLGGEYGLQHFDGERFRSVRAHDPEALRGISGIIERANGDLWLNGLGGIVHIRRPDLERALSEPGYVVNTERFDRHSGVPGIPSQQQQLPTAAEGTDGRLWFALFNEVVWLDPANASAATTPPPVSIQSIAADDKVYEPAPSTTFPPGTTSLRIAYAAVSLLHPDAVRFRHRLKGIDAEWHDAGRNTSVSYRGLSPGAYRFEVGATDANGIWSTDVAKANFTILPAFYQTPWFRTLVALLLLLLAWAGFRLRIRRLQRQFEATLDARVAERTRIARELHDTLLQSFHGLLLRFQTASNLLPDRPAESKQILASAIDQAAEAITEGRDAVQGLRTSATETNDLVDSLRALAEELANENPNDASLHIEVQGTPRALHPIVRDEVFRVTGEALRNAFRHAGAKQIEVELSYDKRHLRVRIRDDGKGIDPEVLRTEGREGHFGLRGMRERAKLAGGKLTVWSGLNAGTEVELSIPALHAYGSSSASRS